MNISYMDTPIGRLRIVEEDGFITGISLLSLHETKQHVGEKTEILSQALRQLEEYFDKKRTEFDIPILLKGTDFQKKVWSELTKIPYGETRNYGQIAQAVGNKKACRAVGGANNKNPILIVVPCHRVIGKSGELTGFACGLEAKKLLLEIEKNT